MLTLAGIPAVYIHSLLGSRNNVEGMLATGHNRTINRAKLHEAVIEEQLDNPRSFRAQVFNAYVHLLKRRTASPAFHPHGSQRALELNEGRVFAVERTSPDGSERILAVFNVTPEVQMVQLSGPSYADILAGEVCAGKTLTLAPYQVRWLRS
jgi:sucrose phosphorylase